jgi:hypothetical protein
VTGVRSAIATDRNELLAAQSLRSATPVASSLVELADLLGRDGGDEENQLFAVRLYSFKKDFKSRRPAMVLSAAFNAAYLSGIFM